jgi:hypothetical protein
MARRITIHDDEAQVETTVVVETTPTGQRITHLALSAAEGGDGIQSRHLLMLQDFGLTMPNGIAPPAAVAGGTAAPASGSGKRKPLRGQASGGGAEADSAPSPRHGVTKSVMKNGAVFYRAPSVATLKRIHDQCDGDATRMAEVFGVPRKTVENWLTRARRNGAIPRARKGRRP